MLAGAAAWSWQLVFAAVGATLALQLLSHRVLRRAPSDLRLLPLWDIVSFARFVARFWSSRVTWRGFRFEVDSDCLLSAVQDERVTD